jgi:hypothetical protein
LVEISVEALHYGRVKWNWEQVRQYLSSQLENRTGTLRGSYGRLLKEHFGVSASGTLLVVDAQTANGTSANPVPQIRFQRHLERAAAPDCAAILACLGIDFSEAATQFKRTVLISAESKVRSAGTNSTSLEKARKDALQARSAGAPLRPKLYWFLRLYDTVWLRAYMVRNRSWDPTPSPSDDRKYLEEIAADDLTSFESRLHRIASTPAGIRSALRDKNWRDALLKEVQKRRSEQRLTKKDERTSVRAKMLSDALLSILEMETRPEVITARILGNAVGFSVSQTQKLIARSSSLRKQIQAANSGRLRRLIFWAARRVKAQGKSLSQLQIRKTAGVLAIPNTIPIMREAARVVGAGTE